ncbi:ferredoxin [Streptomyces scopuliridis]|uniref:ferredoxin n=1 Tax=Streptomyces scopuliridis TaxID=452529 RepID=UPI00342F9F5E
MKITIDEDKCCSAGQCVLAAPEIFDQRDADGVVVLLDATPELAQHASAREAQQICPASAIAIDELTRPTS